MSTPDDGAVAASQSVDPASWRELFDELMSLVAGRFGRVEPRRTAREFVLGLLSPAERSVRAHGGTKTNRSRRTLTATDGTGGSGYAVHKSR